MRALVVAAARPNFMKVKPVVDALEAAGAETWLVHTGQHYDAAMSDVFFDELGLRLPDRHLEVGSGTHAVQTAGVMTAFEPLLDELAPDWVVVAGDVNSTLACALVTAKSPSRLAHVEAGLRSNDWTMPEEVNRVVTDRISDLLLAPSPDAVENLAREGTEPGRVELVGNVMIDTLLANLDRAEERSFASSVLPGADAYGVVTLHRPANVDDPAMLENLLLALGAIGADLPLIFPVHPRTRKLIDALGPVPGLTCIDAVSYLDFVSLEAGARLVLTDSGGVQEETTVLGVPCLTLRDNTERPITVTEGTNQVVGRDPECIIEAALAVLSDPPAPRHPELWDGAAGTRIAAAMVERS